jgi:hypothetical protein
MIPLSPLPPKKTKTFPVAQSELVCFDKLAPAGAPSGTTRAASPRSSIPPPPLAEAVEYVRKESNSGHYNLMKLPTSSVAVHKLLERFWPRYVRDKIAAAMKYYGSFDVDRDLSDWKSAFRFELEREGEAINRYVERREKWMQNRARAAGNQARRGRTLRGLTVCGIEITSRYCLADELDRMRQMILTLPGRLSAEIASISCDSRRDSYSVVLRCWNQRSAEEIAYRLNVAVSKISGGHNGITVAADDGSIFGDSDKRIEVDPD